MPDYDKYIKYKTKYLNAKKMYAKENVVLFGGEIRLEGNCEEFKFCQKVKDKWTPIGMLSNKFNKSQKESIEKFVTHILPNIKVGGNECVEVN